MAEDRVGRREFFGWVTKRGLAVGLASASAPAFLAACARAVQEAASPAPTGAGEDEIRALVGDVTDFELTSDDWEGAFGFVTFKLHRGVFGGRDVYFIRTDASSEAFATEEKLVWVPKLQSLSASSGSTGRAYIVSGGTDDQPVVLSSEPGRDDYTPAWRIHQVKWSGRPRQLTSVDDVERAEQAGDLSVERTDTIANYPVVKWPNGELPADTAERRSYLGPGQLLEPPNTTDLEVTFKLHECYPNARYIVTDVSMAPMAEGMHIGHSPSLLKTLDAKAAGRTNVFMNGIEGSGPMGFQPSVFDSEAGDARWSPYWEHFTYAWNEGVTARLLKKQKQVHAARDDGDLEEFAGTPDTKGETFVVNCPVPVHAPNTFRA